LFLVANAKTPNINVSLTYAEATYADLEQNAKAVRIEALDCSSAAN
jgi:hypothetical protein